MGYRVPDSWGSTAGYSLFDLASSGPGIRMQPMMPQLPRQHVMRCPRCNVSSMIPDSTDKIMALVCPQCGGALDE